MLHFTEVKCRIRLACVRHAASVRSEPGSNSPLVPVTRCGRVGLPTPPSNTLALARLCLSLCVKEPAPPSRPFPVAVSEGRSISPLFLSSLFLLFLLFFFRTSRALFFRASRRHPRCPRQLSPRSAACVFASADPRSFCQVFLTTFSFFSARPGTVFASPVPVDVIPLPPPSPFCQAVSFKILSNVKL